MVCVIIPVYHSRETLPKALDSLVAQTRSMFMVTISQDGDGEDYSDIIEEYERRGLHINLIKSEENHGPGIARQLAMDAETMCDYVMFLDSDDMLMPRAVNSLYTEAKRTGNEIICSDTMYEKLGADCVYLDVKTTPVTWLHGKIYSLKFLRENDIRFCDDLRMNEDSYFNLVAINCCEKKAQLNQLTYLWRQNKNSLTRGDGDLGYFKKSWDMYLLSQVRGLIRISEITGDINPSLAAATIMNIYYHHTKAKYFQCDLSNIAEMIAPLKDNDFVQHYIHDQRFWAYVAQNLKGSVELDGNLIFCDMKFNDWLKQYVE